MQLRAECATVVLLLGAAPALAAKALCVLAELVTEQQHLQEQRQKQQRQQRQQQQPPEGAAALLGPSAVPLLGQAFRRHAVLEAAEAQWPGAALSALLGIFPLVGTPQPGLQGADAHHLLPGLASGAADAHNQVAAGDLPTAAIVVHLLEHMVSLLRQGSSDQAPGASIQLLGMFMDVAGCLGTQVGKCTAAATAPLQPGSHPQLQLAKAATLHDAVRMLARCLYSASHLLPSKLVPAQATAIWECAGCLLSVCAGAAALAQPASDRAADAMASAEGLMCCHGMLRDAVASLPPAAGRGMPSLASGLQHTAEFLASLLQCMAGQQTVFEAMQLIALLETAMPLFRGGDMRAAGAQPGDLLAVGLVIAETKAAVLLPAMQVC